VNGAVTLSDEVIKPIAGIRNPRRLPVIEVDTYGGLARVLMWWGAFARALICDKVRNDLRVVACGRRPSLAKGAWGTGAVRWRRCSSDFRGCKSVAARHEFLRGHLRSFLVGRWTYPSVAHQHSGSKVSLRHHSFDFVRCQHVGAMVGRGDIREPGSCFSSINWAACSPAAPIAIPFRRR
jgi:hypothetical protein